VVYKDSCQNFNVARYAQRVLRGDLTDDLARFIVRDLDHYGSGARIDANVELPAEQRRRLR